MTDWLTCTQCQLKHRLRPDATCPRCGQAQPAGRPAEQPQAGPARPGSMPDIYDGTLPPRRVVPTFAEEPPEELPSAARVAGGVLALNGVAALVARTLVHGDGMLQELGPTSGGFDLVIGLVLASGHAKIRGLALFRVVAGGLLLAPFLAVTVGWSAALLQAAFSISLALLLMGAPAPGRFAAGASLAVLCLGAQGVGLKALSASAGTTAAESAPSEDLEPGEVERVGGVRMRWHVRVPAAGWYLRKQAASYNDNPAVDRWIVRPEGNAHVVVIAEELPGEARVDMESAVAFVLKNARESSNAVEVLGQAPLPAEYGEARLLHTRSSIKALRVESYHGIFLQDQYVYQVIASATRPRFAELGPELEGIVRSFTSK